MYDAQNKDPQCTACGSPMTAQSNNRDPQTFACPRCKRVQRHLAETEAWLNPQGGNAVTYEIKDGRMISKPAT